MLRVQGGDTDCYDVLVERYKVRLDDTATTLTRSSGFAGVDGLFRLLPDGTSERGLAILEVRAYGPQVIEPPPSNFTSAQY